MNSKIKEQMQPNILSDLLLAEQEMWQGNITVTNYKTSLVSGMHILKEVCYLTTSAAAIHFLW